MSLSYKNSILAQTISVSSTNNTSVTGVLTATSGNFINALQLNSVNVSVSGHTHSGSDIISGTVSSDRLFDNAQASINLYLWANFR